MARTKRCPSCERFIPSWGCRCPYCDEQLVSSPVKCIPIPIAIALSFLLASLLVAIISKASLKDFISGSIATLMALPFSPKGAFALALLGVASFYPVNRTMPGAPIPSSRASIAFKLLYRFILFVALAIFVVSVAYLVQTHRGRL